MLQFLLAMPAPLARGLLLAGVLLLSGCSRSDEASSSAPAVRADLPPTARFTAVPADSTFQYTFDATGSEDPEAEPLTYAWSFGDGTLDSSAVTGHAFAGPGAYIVVLRVTDAAGQSHVAEQTIEVSSEPVLVETDAAPASAAAPAESGRVNPSEAGARTSDDARRPSRSEQPELAPSRPMVAGGQAEGAATVSPPVAPDEPTAADGPAPATPEAALPMDPADRAQALRDAGDPRGALEALQTVTPEDAVPYAQAQVLAGMIHQLDLNDDRAAIEAWHRSIEADPRTYAAHYNLALLYLYDRPDYALAIAHAREVERRLPVIPPRERVTVLNTMRWVIGEAEYKLFATYEDPVERRKYGRRARHSLFRFLDATDRVEAFSAQRTQANAAIAEIETWLRSN